MSTILKYPIDYTQCPKYKKIECHDCTKCIAPDCANRKEQYSDNILDYNSYLSDHNKNIKNNISKKYKQKNIMYKCNSLDDMEKFIKKDKKDKNTISNSNEYPDDPGSSRGYWCLNALNKG